METRHKFEPTMEGQQKKSAEYGKRSSGDITAVRLHSLIVAHTLGWII